MVNIVELDESTLVKTEKLVSKVFPAMDIPEKLSFWAYKHRENRIVKILMKLCGVSSLLKFFAAIDENGEVRGTTGFYSYTKDDKEAIWLAWFCVDPEARGKGIGKQLIEYSIDEGRKYNKKYFRLYTSTDKNEAAAQHLYEKYGFKIKTQKKTLFYTKIIRELEF